jgi:hypothetical protein
MDEPESTVTSASLVRTRLQDTAGMVRNSNSLAPNLRRALSELLDELSRALESPEAAPTEVTRLAEGAAHLAESLHQEHDHSLLRDTRDRLSSLLVHAETRAPTAVGMARRLIDGLADLGI